MVQAHCCFRRPGVSHLPSARWMRDFSCQWVFPYTSRWSILQIFVKQLLQKYSLVISVQTVLIWCESFQILNGHTDFFFYKYSVSGTVPDTCSPSFQEAGGKGTAQGQPGQHRAFQSNNGSLSQKTAATEIPVCLTHLLKTNLSVVCFFFFFKDFPSKPWEFSW